MNQCSMKSCQPSATRNGMLLAVMLAALATGSMILLGTLGFALKQSRQSRHDLVLEQTQWVLDAGISRAIAELTADPDYEGETIRPGAPLGQYQAEITIEVDRSLTDNSVVINVKSQLAQTEGTPTDQRCQRSFRFSILP